MYICIPVLLLVFNNNKYNNNNNNDGCVCGFITSFQDGYYQIITGLHNNINNVL